jgi:hypothetical protein
MKTWTTAGDVIHLIRHMKSQVIVRLVVRHVIVPTAEEELFNF